MKAATTIAPPGTTLSPAEARYIGKATSGPELLRRLAVITDAAAPTPVAPAAPLPQPLPLELNPENPVGALFVGCWALFGRNRDRLGRVIAREPGFGTRGRRWDWWKVQPADGSPTFEAWAKHLNPVPHTDPRVLAAVAQLEKQQTTTKKEG